MNTSTSHAAGRHLLTAIATAATLLCAAPASAVRIPLPPPPPQEVQLKDGIVEGAKLRGRHHNVRRFVGIPYAAPPVGDLRFREPQPVARWAGVRQARQFAPRCMQPAADRQDEFRSMRMSEDCLYVNVWTKARSPDAKLPVLVYFHGGEFSAGDGSLPRYDGANFASRGIVMVTVNYRLGAFGFLAPADAARESSHGTSGNYGLLDQVAALRWVKDNIAQFGGDPSKVTIAGDSAGSIAVSAHMASPLSRGLFARAIGESGAAFAPNGPWPREKAERAATAFAARVGAATLQQLRSLPAQTLLDAARPSKPTSGPTRFWPSIDGYFLTESPEQVFANGAQAQVPLLLGSNSQERLYTAILADAEPTPANWQATIQSKFPARADEVLAHYPGTDTYKVKLAGTALASDLFLGHSTWRWMTRHRETGRSPVFYYRYEQPLPPALSTSSEPGKPREPVLGAKHDAQIAYALGNLDQVRGYAWTATDHNVSRIFSTYVEQFVKTGAPSSAVADAGSASTAGAGGQSDTGQPTWPPTRADNRGLLKQVIGEHTYSTWDRSGPRQGLVQRLVADAPSAGPVASTIAETQAPQPSR